MWLYSYPNEINLALVKLICTELFTGFESLDVVSLAVVYILFIARKSSQRLFRVLDSLHPNGSYLVFSSLIAATLTTAMVLLLQ